MSATKKTLFTETTEVAASKSVGEITSLLIGAGARSIHTEYTDGKIASLSFVMPFGSGQIPYRLPVRVAPVAKLFYARRQKTRSFPSGWQQRDADQAERVAWRQLYWWLKAQLALIELGMVESGEVLMPYMLAPDGRSFFDTYKPKMLAAPQNTEGAEA